MNVEKDPDRFNSLLVSNATTVGGNDAFVSVTGDDGKASPGNPRTPYATLDAAFAAVGGLVGSRIYLGPGRFPFRTPLALLTDALLKGAGRFATVLESLILGKEASKHTLISGWNGGGQRVEDLTIDCGGKLPGWGVKSSMIAVDLARDSASVSNVDCVNLMSSDSSVESFGLCATYLDRCRVLSPTPNNGVYTAFVIRKDGAASNCVVDMSNAPAAFSHGYTPEADNVKILNCAARGVLSAVYSDTAPNANLIRNITVRGCTFENLIRNGAAVRLRPVNELNDALEDVVISDNVFHLGADDVAVEMRCNVAGVPNVGKISRISIAGNHITSDGNAVAVCVIEGVTDGVIGPNAVFGSFKSDPYQRVNCTRVVLLADVSIAA